MSKKNNLSLRKKQHEFEIRKEQEAKEKAAKKLQMKKNKMKVKFSKVNGFKKPFEEQALKRMDSSAMVVLEEFKDIVYGYGQSDEYSFVLGNNTQLYQRFDSKLVSAICSVFTDAYVKKWKEFLPQKELQYAPRFDGRAVCYESYKEIRDYLSWRQADCHINSKHNTLFWARVHSGESKKRAQINLQGILRKEWYTILLQEFGIDYTQLPLIFRNGSPVFWADEDINGVKKLVVEYPNIIRDDFWEEHSHILKDTDSKLTNLE